MKGDRVIQVLAAKLCYHTFTACCQVLGWMLAPPQSVNSGFRTLSAAAAALQVDQTFEVRGVGSVVSGTVVCGAVTLGQRLLLGPDEAGTFRGVTVTCIQREQVPHGTQVVSVHRPRQQGSVPHACGAGLQDWKRQAGGCAACCLRAAGLHRCALLRVSSCGGCNVFICL